MRGYLYIAHGERFVEEATRSVRRLRAVDPDARCALATGGTVPSEFVHGIACPANARPYSKLPYLSESPFEETIFLDTDTWAVDSPRDLFRLLDWYDLAMAPAPAEVEIMDDAQPRRPIVGLVPHNTGVIVYRNNRETHDLFEAAEMMLRSASDVPATTDQPFLGRALAESRLRVHTLTNAWNFRTPFPGTVFGRVHLLHGHLDERQFRDMAERINRTTLMRSWNPFTGEVVVPREGSTG